MRKFKHVLLSLLTLVIVNSVMAQEVDQEISCYARAEGEYSYQTEVLLHVYERAQVSPREFENLRTQLITARESALHGCEQKSSAEMDKLIENIQINTVVHQPSEGRGIASIDVRQPVSEEHAETHRRGAYIEVDTLGAAYVQQSSQHEDDIPEYSGERVSIGN